MRHWLCVLAAFAAVDAARGQEPKVFVNSLGMKLVRVEPGSFVMGQGDATPKSKAEWTERDWDESPAHTVRISKAYMLGMHEVTNAQFAAFDPEHRTRRKADGAALGDDDPVTFVAWDQAVAFCAWLAKKEQKPYRLPTEAEWEFACRAGTTTRFSVGDALTAAQANFGVGPDGKPCAARPVGSYAPNPWGFHDLHGNVAEWCQDWHGAYPAGDALDPVGADRGYARVTRGGSFLYGSNSKNPTFFARSANRSGHVPGDANRATGFRVAFGDAPATKPWPRARERHETDVTQTPAPLAKPARPYFVSYPLAKTHPTIASDSWGPVFAQWNHFSAVCVCPNGDVLAAWYTCVTEPGRELAQAASRLRVGSDRWEQASSFFDVPDVNDHAPVLLRDGNRIWHFCTQSLKGWDNASNVVRWSDDNGATWSVPQVIVARERPDHLSQPCTAFVEKDGTIVLACDGDLHKDERIVTSSDRGVTWTVRKGDMRKTVGAYAIHPAIAPLADGSIVGFLRGPKPMPSVRTRDRGDTYELVPTKFPGLSSGMKPTAKRLASGALLLVSIDTTKSVVGGGTFAALSLDDGKTWPHVRKLDGVGGYMSCDQGPNGVIHVFGTRMGCVSFDEAWLRK